MGFIKGSLWTPSCQGADSSISLRVVRNEDLAGVLADVVHGLVFMHKVLT